MAGVSRQRTGIPGRDALDHHAARAALAVEVRLPAPVIASQRVGANARRGRENVSGTPRHCERSEAIHSFLLWRDGLLRCARNDGRRDGLLRGACHRARIRATRWLAMTGEGRFMPPLTPATHRGPPNRDLTLRLKPVSSRGYRP